MNKEKYIKAASLLKNAKYILVCTGAGMGVGSGFGTFRGLNSGVWPPLKKLGLEFDQISNPTWFLNDPKLAWSFWNFRFMSYTRTKPHKGYEILKEWVSRAPKGYFSFTSNIDGHILEAGFNKNYVLEIHGAVRYLQCLNAFAYIGDKEECSTNIWPADDKVISSMIIDSQTDRVVNELPKCPSCGGMARPNVLMFDDSTYIFDRRKVQYENYNNWLKTIDNGEIVILEIGAGRRVPTVRNQSESIVRRFGGSLVRINPSDIDSSLDGLRGDHVSITDSAENALQQIHLEWSKLQFSK